LASDKRLQIKTQEKDNNRTQTTADRSRRAGRRQPEFTDRRPARAASVGQFSVRASVYPGHRRACMFLPWGLWNGERPGTV